MNSENKIRNEINLIYDANKNSICNIFGNKFVDNNRDNIKIIINGKTNKLVNKYKLKKGDNIIQLSITNKLTNLSYMFFHCNNLKDLKELKYLNVNEIKHFGFMFSYCSSLSDIKSLQNWNGSNGNNFSYMFKGCSSLSDIKPLQNWKYFKYMFDKSKYN